MPKNRINILFWNGFWQWPYHGMGKGNKGFIAHNCKYTNCYTSIKRSELFQSDKIIDAVIVHEWDKDLSNELRFRRIGEAGIKVS